MINAVIIDDEPRNIDMLDGLLNKFCQDVHVIGSGTNGIEAEKLIREQQPQLVFLDIEMPFGNAFDLLDKLLPVRFEVIFVTAFDQYAIRAFEYAALDYLLKPINIEKLQHAVKKVLQRLEEKSINTRIDMLVSNYRSGAPELTKIALPSPEGLIFEETKKLIRFEAKSNYTYVFIIDQKKRMVAKSLKEFEEILPPSIFCRVHHSHIINLNHVKKYHKGRGGYVEMEDGTMIEVSSRRREEFLAKFGL